MAAIIGRITVFFAILTLFVLFPCCANRRDKQGGTLEACSQSDVTISEAVSNPENEDVVESDTAQITLEPEKPVTKYYSGWTDNISDISFLSKMKDLEEVTIIGSCLLSDISPLASLSGLKRIDLPFCPNIQSIEPLSALVNLEYLFISPEKPVDCVELRNLTKLKELHLPVTPVTNIEYIARLTELEKLSVPIPNESVDISQLGQLTKLNELNLSGYQTKVDLDGFQRLVNLERLVLFRFIGLDLQLLADPPQLKYLDFDGSTLLDMMQLVDIKALAFFYLPLNYADFPDVYPVLKRAGVDWGPKHDR